MPNEGSRVLGNGLSRLIYWILGIVTLVAASASAGYIAAYERRLTVLETLAATTAATQVQRGERFSRIESRVERHEEIIAEIRDSLRDLKKLLEPPRASVSNGKAFSGFGGSR